MMHHESEIKSSDYSEEDKILFTKKYQNVIAKSTVKYLEKDFLESYI
jgi:hypothetical protein